MDIVVKFLLLAAMMAAMSFLLGTLGIGQRRMRELASRPIEQVSADRPNEPAEVQSQLSEGSTKNLAALQDGIAAVKNNIDDHVVFSRPTLKMSSIERSFRNVFAIMPEWRRQELLRDTMMSHDLSAPAAMAYLIKQLRNDLRD